MQAEKVLSFWFEEIEPKQWWVKDPEFDNRIRETFSETHQAAVAGELFSWRKTPEGRLAEVIVLDQFSRNMFREDPRAWQYDGISLILSQEAIACGDDQKLSDHKQLAFLYMPFMHSESRLIHEESIRLFSQPGLEMNLDFAHKHKVIIDRFGRYPHRNADLGRESTAEELEFLQRSNSSF